MGNARDQRYSKSRSEMTPPQLREGSPLTQSLTFHSLGGPQSTWSEPSHGAVETQQLVSFKLNMVLSSVMESRAVPPCSTWDVDCPFVHSIDPIYATHPSVT